MGRFFVTPSWRERSDPVMDSAKPKPRDHPAPTVTYSGNAGTYTIDQTVMITCTAIDPAPADGGAASGLASTTCQNVQGPAYTFTLSSNTVSATALDLAENMRTGTATFTVQTTVDSLCALTRRLVTNAGFATGMCAVLNAAKLNAQLHVPTGVTGELQAYRQQIDAGVQAHALTGDQATVLRAAVYALGTLLLGSSG